jgi:tetratricopeptide (TPR) repeat protein
MRRWHGTERAIRLAWLYDRVRGDTDRLIGDADWNAEMALRAFADGHYQEALPPAIRAVEYTRRILRWRRDDLEVIEALAWRYRCRAEVHQTLGHHREAIDDTEEVLKLLHRLDDPPRLAEEAARLVQCEAYAALGDVAASREAGRAIEAFQGRLGEAGASPLAMAEAFGRHARAMALIGDGEQAQRSRRQAIDAYRANLDGMYGKDDRVRFVALVQAYVAEVEPSDDVAPVVVRMLQDAAEQLLRLVPPDPFAATDATVRDCAAAIIQMVVTQGHWLAYLVELEASAVLAQRAPTLLNTAVPFWPDWLQANRKLIETTLGAESS